MRKNRAVLLVISSSLVLVAKAANEAPFMTNSLRDCRRFAQLFDYTYYDENEYAKDGSGMEDFPYPETSNTKQLYEYVQCNYPGICPDGNDAKISCTWQRFLHLSCQAAVDGTVYIAISTNSLPNHCYFAQTSYPLGSQTSFNAYVFSARFNTLVKDQSLDTQGYVTNLADQSAVDLQLCNEQGFSTVSIDPANVVEEYYAKMGTRAPPNQAQYQFVSADWRLDSTNYGLLPLPTSDAVVGVALNGVFFFSGTSQYGYDVFYPKAYGRLRNPRSIEVDHCLGSVDTYKTYRYYSFSPCIYKLLQNTEPALCSQIPSCKADPRTYAVAKVPAKLQSLNPIGLAKDGRVIYGPFKADGTLWQPCDVDVCNGRMFQGYYGYVATAFHPYLVGCFGPGNMAQGLPASCSSNARLCSNAQYINSIIAIFGTIFATILLAF